MFIENIIFIYKIYSLILLKNMEKHLFILSHLQEKYHHNDILYVRG